MSNYSDFGYSVLMSVYKNEDPEYLDGAILSMINQTIKPADFVLVKDGQLTPALDAVISKYVCRYPTLFQVLEYRKNRGLGYALNFGLEKCVQPYVARMDSDDVACPDRIEKQLEYLKKGYDLVGAQVYEFVVDPERPISFSSLPLEHVDIVKFSKRRNPFRHPTIFFDRELALKVGGYNNDYPFFEDWDFVTRMIQGGARTKNLNEALTYMRTSDDFYQRRGGLRYCACILKFKFRQYLGGYTSIIDFVISTVPHIVISLMPNKVRKAVYMSVLRDNVDSEDMEIGD